MRPTSPELRLIVRSALPGLLALACGALFRQFYDRITVSSAEEALIVFSGGIVIAAALVLFLWGVQSLVLHRTAGAERIPDPSGPKQEKTSAARTRKGLAFVQACVGVCALALCASLYGLLTVYPLAACAAACATHGLFRRAALRAIRTVLNAAFVVLPFAAMLHTGISEIVEGNVSVGGLLSACILGSWTVVATVTALAACRRTPHTTGNPAPGD